MIQPSIFGQSALAGSSAYICQGDMIKLEPTFMENKLSKMQRKRKGHFILEN
jgi:hypothetical protein